MAVQCVVAEDAQQLPAVTVSAPLQSYGPPPTRTATKTDTPLIDTPQSVQVIPKAVLDDQAVVTLQDATKNVAGVGASYSFMGLTNSCVRVRGFSNEQGSVGCTYYRNGVRMWAQPLPFSSVESIEVVKGPNTVLFGRNEPGGMVNIVTKRPTFERLLSLQQSFGSFDTFITKFDAGGALNDDRTVAGRLNIGYFDTDNFRDRAFETLADFDGALTWQISPRTTVDLDLDFSRQVYQPDFGIPALGNKPAPIPVTRSMKQDYIDSVTKSYIAELDIEHRLNDTWKVNAKGFYAFMEPNYFNVYGFGLDETTGDQSTFYFGEQYSTRRTWQGVVDVNGTINALGMRHDLLFGIDYYDEDYDGPIFFSDAAPPINIFNPQIGSAPRIYPTRDDFTPYAGLTRWWGFYAQDTVHLTERLILNVGFRHDIMRALFADPTVTSPNEDSATNPRVGLVFKLRPNLSLYTQYQESTAPNNGSSSTNVAFDPQQAKQIEVGAKFQTPDERLFATLAVFELRKQNLLTSDLTTVDPTDSAAVGEVTNRGIELDVSGRVTDRLSLIGSYAYSDAEISEDNSGNEGNRYEGVPRHAGSIWGRYDFERGWSGGLGVFAEGERAGDLGNTFVLPGYARVDAMLQYKFNIGKSNGSLQFNVNNILDKEWYAGVYRNSRDFILPGTTRQFMGTVRIEY
jgi:iron complex outermembrane receptor protein